MLPPLYQDDATPFARVNIRGEPRRVLPTLVSYARNHAFRPRWDGRPEAEDTWAPGLSNGARCELIGRAMDRYMMAWLGGLLGALNRP